VLEKGAADLPSPEQKKRGRKLKKGLSPFSRRIQGKGIENLKMRKKEVKEEKKNCNNHTLRWKRGIEAQQTVEKRALEGHMGRGGEKTVKIFFSLLEGFGKKGM